MSVISPRKVSAAELNLATISFDSFGTLSSGFDDDLVEVDDFEDEDDFEEEEVVDEVDFVEDDLLEEDI